MWEFWDNKKKNANDVSKQNEIARLPSLTLTPEQGLATVAEVTVVPNYASSDLGEQPAVHDGDGQAHVYFKDLKLLAHDNGEESGEENEENNTESDGLSTPATSPTGEDGTPRRLANRRRKLVDRQKLVIILVGLPARGKTFLCNKLMCYFNWLGHPTRHFNVGNYRRRQQGRHEIQDASFFDPSNVTGAAARHRALLAALDDMETWLDGDSAQVAIFDATNTTDQRRNYLRDRLHGRLEYMFLESVCNDASLLEKNYRLKMQYSPDYAGMDMNIAIADFKERIRKYESVYETITDRSLHYVKLIDMVTGRGHMDVNRISGYIPGKMVFFLMQICKALGRPRRIWLTRHGESQYNVAGKIGGNSSLSPRGAAYAQLLPVVLASRVPSTSTNISTNISSTNTTSSTSGSSARVVVWTSTLTRTIETASLLPFPKVQWKALDEIQAGICDGMTYHEIKTDMPDEHEARKKDKLRYRYPSGESYMDVIQRLEPVVIEAERDRECVCIVAHQAVLRALYGYFMNKPLDEVPRIEIPLHTLMELTPKADGTMAETRYKVDVDKALREIGWVDVDGLLLHRRMGSGAHGGGGGMYGSETTDEDDEGEEREVKGETEEEGGEAFEKEKQQEGMYTNNNSSSSSSSNNSSSRHDGDGVMSGSGNFVAVGSGANEDRHLISQGHSFGFVPIDPGSGGGGGSMVFGSDVNLGLGAHAPGGKSSVMQTVRRSMTNNVEMQSENSGGFVRSISMAELAAAELVVAKKMPENHDDEDA